MTEEEFKRKIEEGNVMLTKRAAANLLERKGNEALPYALIWALELCQKDDRFGAAMWLDISQELIQMRPA